MKRVLKLVVIGFVLLNVAVAAVGVAVKLLVKTEDDLLGDELSLPAILGGVEFTSGKRALSYVRVVVYAGGAMLDVSEAELGPDGLDIEATTIMGGVDITVPRNCRVELVATTFMGGTDAAVPETDLPDDAREVRVRCTTVLGGLAVHYPEDEPEPAVIDEQPEPQPVASV